MRMLVTLLLVLVVGLSACDSDEASSPAAPSPQLKRQGHALPVLQSAHLAPGRDVGLPSGAQHFQITLRFINTPTADQRAQFETAARRWQSLIHGDVFPVAGLIPPNACGADFPLPAFDGVIDDIMINVLLQPIDGPGNILGAAGACLVRTNDWLPVYGLMFFDTADLDFLEGLGLLDEVIVHEMGHVLGFSGGIFNLQRSLLANPNTVDPRFLGRHAIAQYTALGGKGTVPIEGLPCGLGTRNSHWDERTFFNELMTGFLNAASSNFLNPMSPMTAAAMRDLGYKAVPQGEKYALPTGAVNDPCPVPAAASAAVAETDGIDIGSREILIDPLMRIE